MLDPISTVALSIVIAGIAVVALSPRFAEPLYRVFLFEPHKYPHGEGDWNKQWAGAQPCEDVSFRTKNGARLHGWFFPQTNAPAAILVHHGNTGNIADIDVIIQTLLRTGVSVFVYDYRGYGKSESSPSVAGVVEDGIAAYDWLKQRVGDQPIVFYGESLGGAIACQVALARRPKALILQSAFFEMRRIACENYPFFRIWPADLFPRPYFHSARAVNQLQVPLLVLHGAKDSEVRVHHAHDLIAAATGNDKKLIVLPNTDHHEIFSADVDLAVASIAEFVKLVVNPAPNVVPNQAGDPSQLIDRMRSQITEPLQAGHQ
ncbi:MAG TPA: alpha/beta hydrolase [Planktothrix sp.]|jgi:hypothetical protein